jgi:uncharacterized protein YjbJ (UPF0337 family)
MDKDRIEGVAKQAKGTVKEAVGKVVGDAKLQAEGKADQAEGKLQNAVGGLKDTIRKACTGSGEPGVADGDYRSGSLARLMNKGQGPAAVGV